MRVRRLGNTNLHLSVIGCGTWAMGGTGWKYSWGPQDDGLSVRVIHRALDLGINWIDTAAVYGLGHSEEVVGRSLKGMRERPLVATKCGRFTNPDGSLYSRIKKESIRLEAEKSLKRLGIEAIDLYQIHWPLPEEDIEEAWQAMAGLVAEGKVRHIGVSNFSVGQMERIHPIHPIASLQPPYSLLRREIENDILPFCLDRNIGVICYSPLQKGLLSGKITKERMGMLPEEDHRGKDPLFSGPKLESILTFVDGLRPVAAGLHMTLPQLAVAWMLRRSEVTAAIAGCRNPDQIAEIAGAADRSLDEESIRKIDGLAEMLPPLF
jgi:aryl-alcohol dehydrogenase-like predicted oxidoreductase